MFPDNVPRVRFPITEISTRNLPEVKGRPTCKADNITAINEPIV
jgi:hypothetical protein